MSFNDSTLPFSPSESSEKRSYASYDVLIDNRLELLCRHAKACHLYYQQIQDESKKEFVLNEGAQAASDALKLNETHFEALKQGALIAREKASFLEGSAKKRELAKFKNLADRALHEYSDDFELLYLRGLYHFKNPEFSWIQHICFPCSFSVNQLAIEDFLEADSLRPNQYIDIHYHLALCYKAAGNVKRTLQHFRVVDELEAVDAVHRRMQAEARDMLIDSLN